MEVIKMMKTDSVIRRMRVQRELTYRNILFGVVVLCFVLLFSIAVISQTVNAQRSLNRTKLVTSVEIKKGDTLWSIAANYITEEYKSINHYIEEIKYSNGLSTDQIQAGNFIIVPYYSDMVN